MAELSLSYDNKKFPKIVLYQHVWSIKHRRAQQKLKSCVIICFVMLQNNKNFFDFPSPVFA